MNTVKITHTQDGRTLETLVPDPEFVDVLANVNEAVVDGRVFKNVTQVRYEGGDE